MFNPNVPIMMNRYLGSLIVSLFSLTSVAQLATFTPDPQLTTLVGQMENFYPNLKIQEQQRVLAHLQTEIAQTALLPILSGQASYNYITPVSKAIIPAGPVERELQFQPNHNVNTQVVASYLLSDFGRTKLNVQKAFQNETVATASFEASKFNLGYQVATTYYNLMYTNKAIAVKDTEIVQILRSKQQNEDLLKNGTAIDYDVLVSDVRLKSGYNQRADLVNAQQKTIVLLNSLTGVDNRALAEQTIDFHPAPIPTDDEAIVEAAIQHNLDLRTQRERTQLATYDVRVADKYHLPTITLSGTAGFKNGIQPDITQFRANTNLGAVISVPIYAGDRNKMQINVSKANLQVAQLTADNTINDIRKNVYTALSELRTLGAKYQTINAQIEQVRRALELAKVRLAGGVLRPIDLTDAQNNYVQVLLVKVQFEYQLQLAELQLRQLLGEQIW